VPRAMEIGPDIIHAALRVDSKTRCHTGGSHEESP